MTRIVAAAALVTVAAGALTVGGSPEPARAAGPVQLSYVVSPHPDDEFQAWSLIEKSPDNYKVFLTMTRGEQTGFCTPAGYAKGLQAGQGETAQNPAPAGQGTASCVSARQSSLLRYLTQMSASDSTIPGDWNTGRTTAAFPANGAALCNRTACGTAQRSAMVWTDKAGRGAVVSFDLGDGDLTAAEVTWAIRTVQANKAGFFLPNLRDHNILGGYSNIQYSSCKMYDHPDHRAVHQALWSTNFGTHYQAGATCASDPDVSRSATVSTASVDAAFAATGAGVRTGAHVKQFGWLNETYYVVDRTAQKEVFHAKQSFWVRWANP